MAQMKCPNCGGYKVSTPGANPACGIFAFYGFGGLLLLLGLMGAGPPLYLGIGLIFVGIAITVAYSRYAGTHHECLICGKVWETPGYRGVTSAEDSIARRLSAANTQTPVQKEERPEQQMPETPPLGLATCKVCGQQQPASRELCSKCGAPLYSAGLTRTPSSSQSRPGAKKIALLVCDECGNYNPEDAKHCLKCGHSLPDQDEEDLPE